MKTFFTTYLKFLALAVFSLFAHKASCQMQDIAYIDSLINIGKTEIAKQKAKELWEKQPKNSFINLLLGKCYLANNQAKESLPYLKFATDRRLKGARLEYAKALTDCYLTTEATQMLEIYKKELKAIRQSTEEADSLIRVNIEVNRMLKSVNQICVIDSIIVDKKQFIKAYNISKETGSIRYMQEVISEDATAYISEIGNRAIISEKDNSNKLRLYTLDKINNKWENKQEIIKEADANTNYNYPFMMSDGVTIYYSADNGGIGGYDIYVTRSNINGNGYLQPENIGMPFNSTKNDYMLVIDEYSNLGWFATDRNTTEDKVCIYVFIPEEVKKVYDNDEYEHSKIISLAKLERIKDTWRDEGEVEEAIARRHKKHSKEIEKNEQEIDFIIDDENVYKTYKDFKTKEGLNAYKQLEIINQEYEKLKMKLSNLRTDYSKQGKEGRLQLKDYILELEKREIELYNLKKSTEKKIREIEKK